MKNFLLFIIIYTSVYNVTYSQSIPERIFPVYSEDYRHPLVLLDEITPVSFNFDPKEVLYRPVQASTPIEKYYYSYDNNGRIISSYIEELKNNLWVKKLKYSYSYDQTGNLSTWLREDWKNSSWSPFSKYNYSFDIRRNLIFTQYQHWENGTWQNDYRFMFSYNSLNKMTEWIHQVFSSANWENYSKYNYTYGGGNLVTTLQKQWDNGIWENLGRLSYFYDLNNNMVLSMGEYWINNNWTYYNKMVYTFDNSGNMLSKSVENWENGNWNKQTQFLYTYSVNNIPVTTTTRNWAGNIWLNAARIIYNYDNNNNLLTELTESWKGNVWESSWNYSYEYDVSGNSINADSYSWQNGWQAADGHLQMRYNNGKDKLSFLCCQVNVQYDTFTSADELMYDPVFSLENNYPNPFNPSTTIKYSLPEAGLVRLAIYNSLGQLVKELKNLTEYEGTYEITFDAGDLSSGIYFYLLESQSISGTGIYMSAKKMILIK